MCQRIWGFCYQIAATLSFSCFEIQNFWPELRDWMHNGAKTNLKLQWVETVPFLRIGSTEVGRAPLIDFQKLFLDNTFFNWKLFIKFRFYTWMTITGRKSVKKGQKMMKKATNLVYNAFFKKNFVLANFK